MQVDDVLAFYGWLFQYKVADWRGCRVDGISIPILTPYAQKSLCVSLHDPHTHRTPKSYIPINPLFLLQAAYFNLLFVTLTVGY